MRNNARRGHTRTPRPSCIVSPRCTLHSRYFELFVPFDLISRLHFHPDGDKNALSEKEQVESIFRNFFGQRDYRVYTNNWKFRDDGSIKRGIRNNQGRRREKLRVLKFTLPSWHLASRYLIGRSRQPEGRQCSSLRVRCTRLQIVFLLATWKHALPYPPKADFPFLRRVVYLAQLVSQSWKTRERKRERFGLHSTNASKIREDERRRTRCIAKKKGKEKKTRNENSMDENEFKTDGSRMEK